MTTSHYELVIAGTDLPGLILGALCAKRGYRILVTGSGGQSNSYEYGGHQFYRQTELLQGFETSPAIKEVMGGLSMALHMRGRPKKREVAYQVVSPEGRVTVGAQDKALEKALERELGVALHGNLVEQGVVEEFSSIERFLEMHPPLPPEGWGERREFAKLLEDHPRISESARVMDPLRYLPDGSPLRGFWEVPLQFSSAMNLGNAAALPRLRSFAHLRDGVYDLGGGIDALREGFIGKVRQYSCDYRSEVQFHALRMKRGKVAEAMVQDRRESIGCDFMVCNGDERQFFNLIAPEDRKERYHHKIHSLAPSHHFFTVNIALRKEGVPVGMERHVFVIGNTKKPLEDENAIHVMTTEGDGDTVVMTATCRLKARHQLPSVGFIQEMTHRVLSQLRERLLPFLDEHIVAVHSPWIGLDAQTGSPFFAQRNVRAVYPSAGDALLDDSPLPLTTEYKNILVCNRNSHSGLGLEGAFLSALNAYRIVEARLPLKSPLR